MSDASMVLNSSVPSELSNDPRKELAYLEHLEDWGKFYELCRTLSVGQDKFESLIIRRMSRELQLSTELEAQLRALLRLEQEDTTSAAVAKYGSGEALHDRAIVNDASNIAFWHDLTQLREQVRRGRDARYAEHFHSGQMHLINEHLRTRTIRLSSTYQSGEVRYLICGVGK